MVPVTEAGGSGLPAEEEEEAGLPAIGTGVEPSARASKGKAASGSSVRDWSDDEVIEVPGPSPSAAKRKERPDSSDPTSGELAARKQRPASPVATKDSEESSKSATPRRLKKRKVIPSIAG